MTPNPKQIGIILGKFLGGIQLDAQEQRSGTLTMAEFEAEILARIEALASDLTNAWADGHFHPQAMANGFQGHIPSQLKPYISIPYPKPERLILIEAAISSGQVKVKIGLPQTKKEREIPEDLLDLL